MDSIELSSVIKNESKKLGFDLVGITSPHIIDDNSLEHWLDNGYNASMHWMESSNHKRNDIFKYFPGVKTIISFAYNYYTEVDNKNSNYKISNYAWGEDYHNILKSKLYEIIENIKKYNKDFEYRVCVDTSPIMEKYWAQKAGIGWIGKHTNLITREFGSWIFLGELIINKELDYDPEFDTDLCGTCMLPSTRTNLQNNFDWNTEEWCFELDGYDDWGIYCVCTDVFSCPYDHTCIIPNFDWWPSSSHGLCYEMMNELKQMGVFST